MNSLLASYLNELPHRRQLHVVHDNAAARTSECLRQQLMSCRKVQGARKAKVFKVPRSPPPRRKQVVISFPGPSLDLLGDTLEDHSCLLHESTDDSSEECSETAQWTSTRLDLFQDEHPPSPTPNSKPMRRLSPEQSQEAALASTPLTPQRPQVCVLELNFLELPLESPGNTRKPGVQSYSILEAIEPPLKSPLKRSKHSVRKASHAA
jgi:hypothetical protein